MKSDVDRSVANVMPRTRPVELIYVFQKKETFCQLILPGRLIAPAALDASIEVRSDSFETCAVCERCVIGTRRTFERACKITSVTVQLIKQRGKPKLQQDNCAN